jgi:hypothetical protein
MSILAQMKKNYPNQNNKKKKERVDIRYMIIVSDIFRVERREKIQVLEKLLWKK